MECFEWNIAETLRCIRLLLERVRSPEGSVEKFQAGRRFFSKSALRHLHSHHLSLSFLFLSLSPFFLFVSRSFSNAFSPYSALQPPDDSESGEERRGGIDAKDGFRYRKDREQDFPSYIPAASYPKIRTYSVTDRFERVSVKVTPSRVYFLINLHGSGTLYPFAHISR